MAQEPYFLDSVRRQVVLKTMHEVCSYRGWTMLAAHVRTNHVHNVVVANCQPEQVLTAMKAYSSRALNESELDTQIVVAGRAMEAHATFGPGMRSAQRFITL